jgi:hypothetical protein
VAAKFADKRSARPEAAGSDAASGARLGATSAASAVPAKAGKGEDVALVCGVSDDGQGVEVIRKRGDRLETGTVRRLEAGKPIHGEVVRLRPRPQAPFLCDVEVEFTPPEPRGERETLAASSGPAQVATESYRKNWDAIYGRGRKPSLLN